MNPITSTPSQALLQFEEFNPKIFRTAKIKEVFSDIFNAKLQEHLKHYCQGENYEESIKGLRLISYSLFSGIFQDCYSREKYLGELHKTFKQRKPCTEIAQRINETFDAVKPWLKENLTSSHLELPLGHINIAYQEMGKRRREDQLQRDKEELRKDYISRISGVSDPHAKALLLRIIEKRLDSWEEQEKTLEKETNDPSEKWVFISHGGGYNSIKDFLSGVSCGYSLEGNKGLGIQVHIHALKSSKDPRWSEGRELTEYAPKALLHFDQPCIFTALIQKCFLTPAPNGYERGLKFENVKYLEGISIQPI